MYYGDIGLSWKFVVKNNMICVGVVVAWYVERTVCVGCVVFWPYGTCVPWGDATPPVGGDVGFPGVMVDPVVCTYGRICILGGFGLRCVATHLFHLFLELGTDVFGINLWGNF